MTALFKPLGFKPFGLVAALALVACNGETAEATPEPTTAAGETAANDNVDPDSGLEVIDVTVTTDEGTHTFRTEVAATDQQKARGMMFRSEMAPDTAMLFPYAEPRDLGFWMRNTSLELDIIFIAEDGTIINIEAGEPYNEESVFSEAPAIAVLELLGGTSAELGIEPGDSVSWEQ